MIPIFRAKKLDGDEYVTGQISICGRFIHNKITQAGTFNGNLVPIYNHIEIDPTTLSIHFPDGINTNSEKVWYNMEEISNIIKEYENGRVESN